MAEMIEKVAGLLHGETQSSNETEDHGASGDQGGCPKELEAHRTLKPLIHHIIHSKLKNAAIRMVFHYWVTNSGKHR